MNTRYKIFPAMLILLSTVFFISCEKLLDVEMKDKLDAENAYKNNFDARSAALGINGLFQEKMADNYFLMNELRADLVDYTDNADEELRNLALHKATIENKYVRPEDYYTVILACNEAIEKIQTLYADSTLSYTNYPVDYSEVMGFRCFVYYQLAQHFSPVIYITEPLENIDMVYNEKYPRLTFDELIDSLIIIMEDLPIKDLQDYDAIYLEEKGAKIDGYSLYRSFVEKRSLLGDLYLTRGSSYFDYYRAALNYRWNSLLNRDEQIKFKCTFSVFAYDYTDPNDLFDWPEMFKTSYLGTTSSKLYQEWFWHAIIDNRFDQTNNIVRYISSTYGNYLVKPSQKVIYDWDVQKLGNGVSGDLRGKDASWTEDMGVPVINKYLLEINSPFQNDADMYMCRTATIFLRYAEAVNRMGKCKLALAMMNPLNGSLAKDPNAVDTNDVTFDFFESVMDKYHEKYLFALSKGVRGRVSMAPYEIDSVEYLKDSIGYVENLISNEYALELAFEGDRWTNLHRIAHRREKLNPGSGAEFLSNAISEKYIDEGKTAEASEVKNTLMDVQNWYIPLE